MPAKSQSLGCISLGLWLALGLLLGCQVITGLSGYSIEPTYLVVILLTGAALLSMASNVSEAAKSLPRILLGLWLALFIRWGFDDIFRYDYPITAWPWMGYFVYGLLIGVPFLVIAFKRVAALGAIRLTVYTGFVISLAFYMFALLHDYSWFGMYVRLGVGMFGWEDGFDWLEGIGVWIGYPDWIMPRLLTYAGLGYLLARRKGLLL
ncbi:MAG: hypothetical protein WCD37_16115, partial [Chloroflexia bacterium]